MSDFFSIPELNPLHPQLPFQLQAGGDPFVAEEILRHLPGKRLVCAGRWRGHDVIAKIYFDPRRHAVHAAREAKGAEAIYKANIPTAALLHTEYGANRDLLLFEKIQGAESALQCCTRTQSEDEKIQLLEQLVAAIAEHHAAGLLQEDLHLDNFLFSESRIYTIDGASVRVGSRPLAYGQALDNLALFFAQLQPRFDVLTSRLYMHYLRSGGSGAQDVAPLIERIRERREERKRELLSKIYRRCSAFETQREHNRFAVWDREDDTPALRQLLKDPDLAMCRGRALKDGRTSTVALVELDGKALLVKRYNLKNPLHAFNRALRETRASISWRNAHRLRFYGVPTPRPIALVEKRWGPIRRVAYFICEYVDGIGCNRYLRDASVPEAEKAKAIEAICALFDQLASLGIAHGDTKASNFLVRRKDLNLIDLDALKQFRSSERASSALERDRRRFLRNWDNAPELKARFEGCLRGGRA